MKEIDFSQLTDQELLDESKKMKSTSIINAVLIGFLFGIIMYSILVNSIGFFTLIPLFLIFKLYNNSTHNEALLKRNEDLEKLLKERKLK